MQILCTLGLLISLAAASLAQTTAAAGARGDNPLAAVGVEQQVALQEVRYKNAVLNGDVAAIGKLLAAGYLGTRSDGSVSDRASNGCRNGRVAQSSTTL